MPDLPNSALFALIPLYAAADRLWGAGKPAFKGKKAVIAAAVLGLGFLLGGFPLMGCGIAWFVYRSLPFKSGSAAPTTKQEKAAAFLRHVIIVPALVLVLLVAQAPLPLMVLFSGLYVATAWGLALIYGGKLIKAREAGQPIGDFNVALELIRGATFGAALSAYFIAG